MIQKENSHVRWVDMLKPANGDLQWIKKELGIHPFIVDELKTPSARAHVEVYKKYIYFIYYFPLYNQKDSASKRIEMDFIVTKDTVLTVHYESFEKVLEGLEVGDEKNSLKLMHKILKHLITFEERELRHIREKAEQVGHDIFKNKELEMLERLTYLKRDISECRIVVSLQRPILESLVSHGAKFWGESSEIYLNDILGDHLKVSSQIEAYRLAVTDFEDTNNQLMNLKISSVMKTFTLLSFLTFPFVLLAALFSMRTVDTPIIDSPHGFWIIAGIMVAGMIILVLYFKFKKWF